MKEVSFFTANIPRGSFRVYSGEGRVAEDGVEEFSSVNLLFENTGSRAEDLFGLGIMKNALKDGKRVSIVYNAEDRDVMQNA